MNATTEQIERAKAMQVKCPHLSLERLIEMEIKKDARNAPKQMTKKDLEKQVIRNNSEAYMSRVECQELNEQQLKNQMNLIK